MTRSPIWLRLPMWLRSTLCRLSRHVPGASIQTRTWRVTYCERCGQQCSAGPR